MEPTTNSTTDSQVLLTQIVSEYFQEQKRKRRYRWVKRTLLIIFFVIIFGMFMLEKMEDSAAKIKPHVGLIDIKGEIINGQVSSSDALMKSLTAAYDSKGLKSVILRIDSPGGSPVQADYMFNAVRHFKKKHPDVKTYAVCVDSCTSAAYYIAAAADEIYANPSSLVGSIGVLYNGFGFVGAMEKFGISRRLKTSGSNKGFMDPFSPENLEQEKDLMVMLDFIHDRFIKQVKKGRGKRLKTNEELFSGLVWTGVQAKELGLIDGFASSGQLMRKVIKLDAVVDYTEKQSVLDRFASRVGSSMVAEIPEALGMRSGLK